MNSKEKINYIDEKKPKDYQQWKSRLPWENEQDKNRLQEEGVCEVFECPICGNMIKETERKVLPEKKVNTSFLCDTCQEAEKVRIARKENQARERGREQRKKEREQSFIMQIPGRYENTISTCKIDYREEFDTKCSIYYGGFGTGKTWRAYEVAYALFKNLYVKDFKHTTEVGMMNEIKAGFTDNSFDKRMNEFKETGLLIVDEMGKNNDSDFNKAQVFEILNYRYDWEKKTILICNCEEKEELYTILSPAILDRFRENIINFGGTSRRYKQKQEDKG